MKIKRFNENLDTSFIDSSWSFDKLDKIRQFQNEIKEIKEKIKKSKYEILPFLTEYIKLHPDLQDDDEDMEEDGRVVEFSFIEDIKNSYTRQNFNYAYIEISYLTSGYENIHTEDLDLEDISDDLYLAYMTKKDVEDFMIFMKDPELYKNAKKYNL